MNAPAPRSSTTRDFGLKAEAARRTAEGVARYRAAHADATGSDKVIALLAALAAEFGREPE